MTVPVQPVSAAFEEAVVEGENEEFLSKFLTPETKLNDLVTALVNADPRVLEVAKVIVEDRDQLRKENDRLKKAILDFGNGADFDWGVLRRIDELEEEHDQLATERERISNLLIAEEELSKKLREENEKLRTALKPFADFGQGWHQDWYDSGCRLDETDCDICPTVRDCMRAAAVLEEQK